MHLQEGSRGSPADESLSSRLSACQFQGLLLDPSSWRTVAFSVEPHILVSTPHTIGFPHAVRDRCVKYTDPHALADGVSRHQCSETSSRLLLASGEFFTGKREEEKEKTHPNSPVATACMGSNFDEVGNLCFFWIGLPRFANGQKLRDEHSNQPGRRTTYTPIHTDQF